LEFIITIMKTFISIIILALTLNSFAQQKADFLDLSLPIGKRVDLLMAKMTIEEKAAQLCFLNVGDSLFDAQGNIDF